MLILLCIFNDPISSLFSTIPSNLLLLHSAPARPSENKFFDKNYI